MLDVCTPAAIDRYGAKIKQYHSRYGDKVWHLIYQIDVRARQEELERKRRLGFNEKANATNPADHPFQPDAPWGWALQKLIEDHEFWRVELEDPAMLVLTRLASLSSVIGGTSRSAEAPARSADPSRRTSASSTAR